MAGLIERAPAGKIKAAQSAYFIDRWRLAEARDGGITADPATIITNRFRCRVTSPRASANRIAHRRWSSDIDCQGRHFPALDTLALNANWSRRRHDILCDCSIHSRQYSIAARAALSQRSRLSPSIPLSACAAVAPLGRFIPQLASHMRTASSDSEISVIEWSFSAVVMACCLPK